MVGGIGALGCLALSLMMQHLLKVKTENTRSPIAIELEEACADRIVGRIEADTVEIDGEETLWLKLVAKDGVELRPLAKNASDLVWRRSHKWPQLPGRLRVEVRGPRSAPVVIETRPQGLDGLRSGRARTAPATGSATTPSAATPPK
jgi:hypothetical protein